MRDPVLCLMSTFLCTLARYALIILFLPCSLMGYMWQSGKIVRDTGLYLPIIEILVTLIMTMQSKMQSSSVKKILDPT